MFSINCPLCNNPVTIADGQLGSIHYCKQCGQALQLQTNDASAPATAPASVPAPRERKHKTMLAGADRPKRTQLAHDVPLDDEPETLVKPRPSAGAYPSAPVPAAQGAGLAFWLVAACLGVAVTASAAVFFVVSRSEGPGPVAQADSKNAAGPANDLPTAPKRPVTGPPAAVEPASEPPAEKEAPNPPPAKEPPMTTATVPVPPKETPPRPPEKKTDTPEKTGVPIMPRNETMSGDKVYQRLLQSTAWILYQDTANNNTRIVTGSGALLHLAKKLVLTNYHVVEQQKQVMVFFPIHDDKNQVIADPKFYTQDVNKYGIVGTVVARNPTQDLALIELASVPADIQPLPLAGKSSSPGQNVHSIGASGALREGVLWRYTPGQVRQVYPKEVKFNDGQNFKAFVVETQSPINSGDSGGPVVNDRIELVAVVCMTSKQSNLVSSSVDIREVRKFLEEYSMSVGSKWEDVPLPTTPTAEEPSDLLALIANLDHKDVNVRTRTTVALANLGPGARSAVPALVRLLKDRDDNLRHLASLALDKIGKLSRDEVPFLRDALQDADANVRRYATSAVGKLGPDGRGALASLVPLLKDPQPEVRQNAVKALGQIGPEARSAFPALLPMLKDPDDEIALLASAALGKIGLPDASDAVQLREALADKRSSVRITAAALLAKLGNESQALTVLINGLTDRDEGIRGVALRVVSEMDPAVLGQLVANSKTAVPSFRNALQNSDKNVRLMTLEILGKLGAEAGPTAGAIGDCLKDKDKDIRVGAIKALWQLGPAAKDGVPALAQLVEDKDQQTALAAIETLGQIGPRAETAVPNLILAFAGGDEMYEGTVEALVKIGKPAVPALVNALSDKQPIYRLGAAVTLGRIGPDAKAAVGPLSRQRKDPVPEVRQAVDKALRTIQR